MKTIRFIYLIIAVASCADSAHAAIRIVASTTDLGSIAQIIGGDLVRVESIVNGASNPHFVEVLPSYMVKIARADLYLRVGMDLDYWSNQLIDGSGNGKLQIVDCSRNIERLEVATTRVDASMGDVHAQGNPHYWLDPNNARIIARTITDALKNADPKNVSAYVGGLQTFDAKLDSKMKKWDADASHLAGTEIVTYHNSWPYLAKYLGIKVAGFVEPKPGIEPTPSHTTELIEMMKARNIKIIGKESYFSARTPRMIAKETGATVIDLPPSVGGAKEASDYFSLIDTIIATLTSATGAQ